jgi:hypothetical protein
VIELKLCPFCGAEPELHKFSVACENPFCEAQPNTAGQSQEEAVAGWNTRHDGQGAATGNQP